MKSLREKLDRPAELVTVPPQMQKRFGKGKMLIPSPRDVEALIRQVPRGKLIRQSEIRQRLAFAVGAKDACPLTTGIFLRLVAESAVEKARTGKTRITPYWRVIRDDGSLPENFPGGPAVQAERLEAEGHRIDRSGKFRVVL